MASRTKDTPRSRIHSQRIMLKDSFQPKVYSYYRVIAQALQNFHNLLKRFEEERGVKTTNVDHEPCDLFSHFGLLQSKGGSEQPVLAI